MRIARLVTLAALLAVTALLTAPATAAPGGLTGDLAAHDPALVAGAPGQPWYVFATGEPGVGGGTIQIRTSVDGRTWRFAGTVWDAIPEWLRTAVPGVGNLWAPELHRHGGTYYLYYAASVFGTNTSVIALATNTTLDPADPHYTWVDRGPVVRSGPADEFNAIDPGVVEDEHGTPWMAFGSFWSGIRMVRLEWPSGLPAPGAEGLVRLADRRADPNAVEAAYVVRRGGWYYLFTSWGQCCKGLESDYRIVVGRSAAVTGPYADRDGRRLLDGGGTTLLATAGDRVGPGGQSVSGPTIAYHYYDATAGGAYRMALRRIGWTGDGWPVLRPDDRAVDDRASPAEH
ncbi:arabinan endo-1,5-alpha-L-arabinosidase [Pseudonocardia sp. CNS-139]|nr:arabinan endo-1,5-alpha-L-arabinosidase [Pseudonocardia sp. CNS-139]